MNPIYGELVSNSKKNMSQPELKDYKTSSKNVDTNTLYNEMSKVKSITGTDQTHNFITTGPSYSPVIMKRKYKTFSDISLGRR